jgi:N6-adenosine-specific RNA methylase IME4
MIPRLLSGPPWHDPGAHASINVGEPFAALPASHFAAILVDTPWSFKAWSAKGKGRSAERHYQTMSLDDIMRLPVLDLCKPDCALFLWVMCPTLSQALAVISAWGFEYKTCAFAWTKATPDTIRGGFFGLEMGMGYWTRANTEVCLLATRGRPKRLHRDVRQVIIAPRREHLLPPLMPMPRSTRSVPEWP